MSSMEVARYGRPSQTNTNNGYSPASRTIYHNGEKPGGNAMIDAKVSRKRTFSILAPLEQKILLIASQRESCYENEN